MKTNLAAGKLRLVFVSGAIPPEADVSRRGRLAALPVQQLIGWRQGLA